MSSSQASPCGVAAALCGAKPVRTAPNLFSLLGRVAIITGGHRGIGLEIALAYAEAGAIVYCLDLPPHADQDFVKVQKFVSELPAMTTQSGIGQGMGRLEYVSCDVTKQKDTWAIVEHIADKEGRLDICVANAGVLKGAEVLDYPGDEFQKLLEVNINGVLFASQAAGRQMAKRNTPGSIILTGSMSGSMTNKDMHWTAYNTSKAAVIQMARSIACELGPKKIRCNTISPGYVYSEMTKAFLHGKPQLEERWCSENPLGRLANPDELRGVALFLGSDASTFCTGSDIIVDGGHRAW
ncbi:sorbose reductase sou1 [Flammula alnicola]|nr:sorbose reductase sou1 [Flammula alnicola]